MRILRWLALSVAVLVVAAVGTLLIPLETWRTGELEAPPLAVVEGGPTVSMPSRVWIDTDAACGHSRSTDPDDCFALLLLARSSGLEITGVSTVFGNADLAVTDETTRSLMHLLRDGGIEPPPVYRGADKPIGGSQPARSPANAAIRAALAKGPLTFVAFGPLTNLASALQDRPDLQKNVKRLVTVMGRRPGHLFHPAEGDGGGMLFGHGPVFRDFNFDKDRAAATAVMNMALPTTLMPYDAARDISITGSGLDQLSEVGGAATWTASRARGWLDFWLEEIGRNGFYPFDLLAAAYVVERRLFDCAEAEAWIGKDDTLWNFWFYDPLALQVGRFGDGPADVRAEAPVLYCTGARPDLHDWLLMRLTA